MIIHGGRVKMVVGENISISNMTLTDLTIIDQGTNKYGLWDWNGKVILPAIFDSLNNRRTGKNLLAAKYKGKYGYIDLKAYR